MPYVKKIGITKTFAIKYLEHIYYKIEAKEHHALTLFYRISANKRDKSTKGIRKAILCLHDLLEFA